MTDLIMTVLARNRQIKSVIKLEAKLVTIFLNLNCINTFDFFTLVETPDVHLDMNIHVNFETLQG